MIGVLEKAFVGWGNVYIAIYSFRLISHCIHLQSVQLYTGFSYDPEGSQGQISAAGYAHDIMGNLNAGAAGWIDWNMLLWQFSKFSRHLHSFAARSYVIIMSVMIL